MIKVNELRIGNIVQDAIGLEKELVVYKLEGPGVIVCENEDFSYPYLEEHLCGIELSPELLESCKFTKSINNQFGGYTIDISDEESIRIVNDYMIGWNWPLYGSTPVITKYLHQLQNLYFILTGKELPVTFKTV